MIVALATPGCATRKYARQQAGAVDQRVSEVDKKQTEAISNLEAKHQKDISRVEERAMGAENKANDAARAAQAADQHAGQASDAAKNATDLAQQANSRAGEVGHVVENLDKYKQVSSDGVLFGFDKATLTPEATAKLDQIAQSAQGISRVIIEIEGYTDRTGPKDYNLALSRRRADAVARYLVDKGVQLRRIHMIGLGEKTDEAMAATAANQTGASQTPLTGKAARKEMRRVNVNVYAPETTLSASSGSPQSQQMSQPAPAPAPDTQQPAAPPPPSPR
jgi:outer membrane protein OmpA-like peptidoglycan-associated protein